MIPLILSFLLLWKEYPFIRVVNYKEVEELSIDDFEVGDKVVLFVSDIKESYPTQAVADTIQLQLSED